MFTENDLINFSREPDYHKYIIESNNNQKHDPLIEKIQEHESAIQYQLRTEFDDVTDHINEHNVRIAEYSKKDEDLLEDIKTTRKTNALFAINGIDLENDSFQFDSPFEINRMVQKINFKAEQNEDHIKEASSVLIQQNETLDPIVKVSLANSINEAIVLNQNKNKFLDFIGDLHLETQKTDSPYQTGHIFGKSGFLIKVQENHFPRGKMLSFKNDYLKQIQPHPLSETLKTIEEEISGILSKNKSSQIKTFTSAIDEMYNTFDNFCDDANQNDHFHNEKEYAREAIQKIDNISNNTKVDFNELAIAKPLFDEYRESLINKTSALGERYSEIKMEKLRDRANIDGKLIKSAAHSVEISFSKEQYRNLYDLVNNYEHNAKKEVINRNSKYSKNLELYKNKDFDALQSNLNLEKIKAIKPQQQSTKELSDNFRQEDARAERLLVNLVYVKQKMEANLRKSTNIDHEELENLQLALSESFGRISGYIGMTKDLDHSQQPKIIASPREIKDGIVLATEVKEEAANKPIEENKQTLSNKEIADEMLKKGKAVFTLVQEQLDLFQSHQLAQR